MGTGFMYCTSTFLRFFHLGRWEAMTSPTSSVSHNTSSSSREKHLLTNGQNRYSALDCHHHQESICQLKSSEVKSAKVSGHVHLTPIIRCDYAVFQIHNDQLCQFAT